MKITIEINYHNEAERKFLTDTLQGIRTATIPPRLEIKPDNYEGELSKSDF